MCAIYGKYSRDVYINTSNELGYLNMMEHRGPDGFGVVYGNYVTGEMESCINDELVELNDRCNYLLGHRRLSIIDLSSDADQPMLDGSQRYVITFNGEIYNHLEIRSELESCGVEFATDHSDTEALLYLYIHHGVSCLDKLVGMFAFVIYDRAEQTLFMARDRLGQKPLYYYSDEDTFIFASELWPLVAQLKNVKVNTTALAQYMVYGFIHAPSTPIEAVKKMPPATYAQVSLNGMKVSCNEYWSIGAGEDVHRSAAEWTEVVKNELTRSVKMQIQADVPYGLFVSGGIDSTLLAKYLREVTSENIQCLGADVPGEKYSEKEYQYAACQKYGLDLALSNVDVETSVEYNEVIDTFDEPFDGGSAVTVYEMLRLADEEMKIVITGDGADELFAGYQRYSNTFMPIWLRILKRIGKAGEGFLRVLYYIGYKRKGVAHVIRMLARSDLDYYLSQRYDYSVLSLLRQKQEFVDIYSNLAALSPFDGVKHFQWLEMKTLLPGRMLYKLDRITMKYGIEGRSPYMDHRLVEAAFKIPEKYNIDRRNSKKILKTLLRTDFGSWFVDRKKKGFGNPLDIWFLDDVEGHMFQLLRNPTSEIYQYLDYHSVLERYPAITGRYQGVDTKMLWRLVVLAEYLEKLNVTHGAKSVGSIEGPVVQ